jgi:hypothetical protein
MSRMVRAISRALRRVAAELGVGALGAGDGDQRLPARRQVRRQVEHEVGIDVDETRQVLGALEVPRQPVQVVGDA